MNGSHPPPDSSPDTPPRWVYTYLVVPPQPRKALVGIRALLKRERAAARRRQRAWTAQLVVEPLVTGILVVSDSPSRQRPINQRVERALRELPAGFAVSAPMRLDPVAPAGPAGPASPAEPADPSVAPRVPDPLPPQD